MRDCHPWPGFRLAVTTHALERFEERCPGTCEAELLEAMKAGEALDTDMAVAILQRHLRPNPGEAFVLDPVAEGIFVVKPDGPARRVVVTYLRLSDRQRAILRPPPEAKCA